MATNANAPPPLLAALASARPRTLAVGGAGLVVALIVALTLGGSAQAVSPPKPDLGTAGQYALLAGSGMTNTGVTTVNGGDIGSTPTPTLNPAFVACPAANCVTLTGGVKHEAVAPNDAVTVNANLALRGAYDAAAGHAATSVGVELGGQTLVGGTYTSGIAGPDTFGITGELFLDGGNNADSVFIFQTDETLTTAGASKVTLIRGAQACNIFWKVGSSATLGGASTFRGNIMAFTSISVGLGVTVDGRLLAGRDATGAGAITLDTDTITKPSTCILQADVDAAAAAAAATAAATAAAVEAARVAEVARVAAVEAARVAEVARVAAVEAARVKAVAAAAAAAAKAEAARVAAAKAAATAAAAAAKAKAAAAEAAKAAEVTKVKAAEAAKVKAAEAAKVKAVAVAAAKAKAAAKTAAVKAAAAKKAAVKAAKAAKAAKVAKATAVKAVAAKAGFTG